MSSPAEEHLNADFERVMKVLDRYDRELVERYIAHREAEQLKAGKWLGWLGAQLFLGTLILGIVGGASLGVAWVWTAEPAECLDCSGAVAAAHRRASLSRASWMTISASSPFEHVQLDDGTRCIRYRGEREALCILPQ